MAKDLNVNITGNASSYLRSLGKAQKNTSKFGAVAKAALVGGAAAGMYALGKAAKIGWDEYNQGAKVAAQTNAVIKSTGGVANVTAQEVEELGRQLMLKSGIDDEVIKSGENVLLTFKGIRDEVGKGNDIFTQATKLTLDFAVAMGKDMNSSAIMVGKALNNPIKGLTALTRVGVTFSDQQTEMITKMTEAGDVMGAQKIILKELRSEFGGSAKAAGETFGGQLNILRERLNNFLGDLTGKAIPYLQQFAHWLDPRIKAALQATRQVMQQWRKTINEVTEAVGEHEGTLRALGKVIDVVGKVMSVVIKIQLFWAKVIATVWVMEIKVAIKAIGILTTVVTFLGDHARTAGRIAAFAFRGIVGPINLAIGAVQRLVGWVQDAVGWFTSLFNAASSTGSALGAAAGAMPTGKQPSRFALGGTVPGPIGAPRMILAHGGETVSMRGREPRGYGPIIVQVDGREILRAVRRAESRELRR